MVLEMRGLAALGLGERLHRSRPAPARLEDAAPDGRASHRDQFQPPLREFPDLVGLIAAAKAAGVTTALDNTWGAGIAFDGFALGCDVVMQALTKVPSGGGDVLMGSVTTRDAALRPFGLDTLAVKIYNYTSEGLWAQAAAPSLVLCLLGIWPALALLRRRG